MAKLDRNARESAFSIVELMIAVVIIVVAILALQATLVSFQYSSRLNKETGMALNEARRQLELVKSQDYDSLVEGVTTFNVTQGEVTLNEVTQGVPVGTVTIGPETGDGIREIGVVVTWRSIQGKERTVRVASLRADN